MPSQTFLPTNPIYHPCSHFFYHYNTQYQKNQSSFISDVYSIAIKRILLKIDGRTNAMNSQSNGNGANYIHYTDPLSIKSTVDVLIENLQKIKLDLIVLCIGTDRSTGDSLGPLTGTIFNQMKPSHVKIYGTLHQPVHAANLKESISNIYKTYRDPFIIAVDA